MLDNILRPEKPTRRGKEKQLIHPSAYAKASDISVAFINEPKSSSCMSDVIGGEKLVGSCVACSHQIARWKSESTISTARVSA